MKKNKADLCISALFLSIRSSGQNSKESSLEKKYKYIRMSSNVR